MSNATPAGTWTSKFRVGSFVCEMTYQPGGGLKAQWSPAVPKAATFSAADMAAYRRGRDALIGEVAKATGQGLIVLEAS